MTKFSLSSSSTTSTTTTKSRPITTTTLTPFHLNCHLTNKRLCYCQYHACRVQKGLLKTHQQQQNQLQQQPNQQQQQQETDSSPSSSYLTHDLLRLLQRRFPRFEREVMGVDDEQEQKQNHITTATATTNHHQHQQQRRLKENEHGEILYDETTGLPLEEDQEHSNPENNNSPTTTTNRIIGATHYISVPKYYYSPQHKIQRHTQHQDLQKRRKLNRLVFVPLKKSSGEWIPMKWDLWRLEEWLRLVHGDDPAEGVPHSKAHMVLRDMLMQGNVMTQQQVEELMKAQQQQATTSADYVPTGVPEMGGQGMASATAAGGATGTAVAMTRQRPAVGAPQPIARQTRSQQRR